MLFFSFILKLVLSFAFPPSARTKLYANYTNPLLEFLLLHGVNYNFSLVRIQCRKHKRLSQPLRDLINLFLLFRDNSCLECFFLVEISECFGRDRSTPLGFTLFFCCWQMIDIIILIIFITAGFFFRIGMMCFFILFSTCWLHFHPTTY